ncbi:Diguanylate cyclase with GAF sensor [Pararobbsia alpina]|jgi:diguanylate cyclase (GGDEF)-like protein|uniref:GGDEF domain-containing protein n=1 Tax=Pararobbsia alpina TaxID=621374 RepID=UPI0039A68CF3
MQVPAIPANETERVERLHALRILDTAPEERFDRLTRLAKRMFDVPMALVTLIDVDRQWFKSRQGIDLVETTRDVSFCAHAIHSDDIMEVPDALEDPRFADNPFVTGGPQIRFYAGCPLTVPINMKLGTLCLLDVKPRELSTDDRALLHDLARMAEEEIAAVQLATMDHLTQLSNRRGFEALARHVLAGCHRLGLPASLFFFDLDHFKQINDTYGHAEGDAALSAFSEVLRTTFRESDVVGRLGGDEFVVLLSNTRSNTAYEALERLRHNVEALNATSNRQYKIAYSVGVIDYVPGGSPDVEALLADADKSMYENKQARRSVER